MEKSRKQIKKKIADIYDETVSAYHKSNYISDRRYSPLKYRQLYIENMIANQSISKNAKILDVGCGPGELILSMLKKGYQVWGVDISQGMIEEAVKTIHENGFLKWNKASVGDIEELDFDKSFFDIVVASGVIEYQKDDTKALMEMNRVLKKGGFLILNVTNKYSYMRLLEGAYSRIRQNALTNGMVEFLKRNLIGKRQDKDRPLIPERRVHSPKAFGRQIARIGFEKVSHNYFHFGLLPKPLDSMFSFINEPIAERMEALTNSRFGIFGGGYIVIAKKVADITDNAAKL